MTLAEWKKTARIIKEAYKGFELDAVDAGVDIFSPEFQQAKAQIRSAILAKMGYTDEEYKAISDSQIAATKKNVKEQLDATQQQIEDIKKTNIPTVDDITAIAHSVAQHYIQPPQIIHQIVKETTIEKPTIIKETINNDITHRVEYDPTSLMNEISSVRDKVNSIKFPAPINIQALKDEFRNDFADNFKSNINTLDMPDWRKLAMGLQGQIDDLAKKPSGGASIGGMVTGGTAGSVLFINPDNTLAQDNSNFFVDETNKRLGVGTTTPAFTLDSTHSTSTQGTLTSFTTFPTTATRTGFTGTLGYSFSVPTAITLTQLGRLYVTGNTQNHQINVYRTDTQALVAQATVLAASASDANGFKYITLSSPVTLSPSIQYIVSSDETSSGDAWKDQWDSTDFFSPYIRRLGFAYNTTPGTYPLIQGTGVFIYNTPSMKFTVDSDPQISATYDANDRFLILTRPTGDTSLLLSKGDQTVSILSPLAIGKGSATAGVALDVSGLTAFTSPGGNIVGFTSSGFSNQFQINSGNTTTSLGIRFTIANQAVLNAPGGLFLGLDGPSNINFNNGEMILNNSTGLLSIASLSASQMVATDSSKNLISVNAPIIQGNDRATGQTGAKNLASVTVGASDTTYQVSANVNVTASTLFSFGVTCTYTDETNTSRVLNLSFSNLAGTFLQTLTQALGAGAYEGIPLHIRAKAGTTIVIGTTGTFTTVTYNLEERILQE